MNILEDSWLKQIADQFISPVEFETIINASNQLKYKKGELILKTSLGDVRHGKLYTYQIEDNSNSNLNPELNTKNTELRSLKEVECKYVKNSDGSVGFKAGNYDKKKTLIIK